MSKESMNLASEPEPSEIKSEYDIRGGVRGKYLERYRGGTNIALLDPDVAAVFPNSEAVNEALRVIIRAVRAANSDGIHGSD